VLVSLFLSLYPRPNPCPHPHIPVTNRSGSSLWSACACVAQFVESFIVDYIIINKVYKKEKKEKTYQKKTYATKWRKSAGRVQTHRGGGASERLKLF
jgi:hypothetical protein